MTEEAQRLYDYTRALASGISIAENKLRSFLPNVYLENLKVYNDDSLLVYEGDYPNRYPQSYDSYLDRIGEGFGVIRGPNEPDSSYRQKIKLVVIKSTTLSGIKSSIETLFSGLGFPATATIIPAHKNFFDGVSSSLNTPIRGRLGSRSYRVIIEIFPNLSKSYNNIVKKVIEGTPYVIEKPGVYDIVLDPDKRFPAVSSVEIGLRNIQFQSTPITIFSSSLVTQRLSLPRRFLSNHQELTVSSTGISANYELGLQINDQSFDFYRNPEYNALVTSFGVTFLREIFSDVTAFSVRIERIVIRNAGSGG